MHKVIVQLLNVYRQKRQYVNLAPPSSCKPLSWLFVSIVTKTLIDWEFSTSASYVVAIKAGNIILESICHQNEKKFRCQIAVSEFAS